MCYMFEQAGHQMRLMENGLFVDSAPEGEKQKIIDENPEIMQILGRRDGRPHDEPVRHRPSHG